MPTVPLKPFIFQEPVTKLTFPQLGAVATFEIKPGPKILAFITTLTVDASATGAATRTIPRPSWGIDDMVFRLGNPNRSRKASELFGVNGLQARNHRKSAGTVQYYQGGGFATLVTVAFNGRTIGNTPVLIDSYEDLALQAALTPNAATRAVFALPWTFAEYWRKDPMFGGSSLGLYTAFDNGSGGIGDILGTPYVDLTIPAATGAVGTMTGVNLSGSLLYTEELAPKGTQVFMVKQKIHPVKYALGDNEFGASFETKDLLQRFSILAFGDTMSKVIAKQGSRIGRNVTYRESQCADFVSEIEGESDQANRFDLDTDQDDDPTRSLALSTTQALSVIATFASANDNPTTARILADYYGPVEN